MQGYLDSIVLSIYQLLHYLNFALAPLIFHVDIVILSVTNLPLLLIIGELVCAGSTSLTFWW